MNDSADIEEDDINDELAETVPYADRLKNAEENIASLEGTQVEIEKKPTWEKMTWTVVEEVFDADVEYGLDRADIGVTNFDFAGKDNDTIIAELLFHLSPMLWEDELIKMNEAIAKSNKENNRKRPVKQFQSMSTFMVSIFCVSL